MEDEQEALLTDEGIEDQFEEAEDEFHQRLNEVIDFIFEERFPLYDHEIGKIVARAEIRFNLQPSARAVTSAIWDHLGSQLTLEDLEGLSEDALARHRKTFDLAEQASVHDAIGEWACEAEAYNMMLINLSATDISKLYVEARTRQLREFHELDGERDVLGFFNDPDANADLFYWGSLTSWTAEEATALSFDKSPDVVNINSLRTYRIVASHSPFVKGFIQRFRQVRRAIDSGRLNDQFRPYEFVKWARDNGIALGSQFGVWASETYPTSNSGTEIDVDSDNWGDSRSRVTIYSLFFGLAVANYNLDPDYGLSPDDRSDAFSAISHDLGRWGIEVDAKTIRRHAKIAREVMSASSKPPNVRPPKLSRK